MPRTKLQQLPTKENVIMEEKQVIARPLFARPSALAKLMGVSYSTVRRVLIEWEEDHRGIDDLYYSLSSTLTVINIERFENYLKLRNKEWM